MIEQKTTFAKFLEDWLLSNFNIHQNQAQLLKMVVLILITGLAAILLWKIAQLVIAKFIQRIEGRASAQWSNVLLEGAFAKLPHIVPAIYITGALPLVFSDYPVWVPTIKTFTTAYITLVVIRIIISSISASNVYYSTSSRFKDRPIASFTQLAKIVVWAIGGLFLLSILIDRNPLALLGALGAVSAVILLIFKDTILGFIASIQLTINDMVQIGDWVSVPKYGADGDVIGIYLTTIKVSNWDKTISTVPTYSFVSDSFKNWRGMEESGGRRIKRSINFKISSVQFCTDKMLKRYSQMELVREHIEKRAIEILTYNTENNANTDASVVNGRRMTNIGVFRAYILNTLKNNPNINLDMTYMVRQLEPTEKGVPLEIYCFSSIKTWIEYEGIQSDIFDHIMATARYFDLEIFESPSSSDLQKLVFKNTTELP
ncbi:MAG: miniconductance mechanosensitive channel [Cyclobacteriaceae bacterium]|jgi:miniconductance mechanosensitive channel